MADTNKVTITLVKSPIGAQKNQKDTLKALGLTKINKSVEKGMIRTVKHLVKVEESK
jgi:large subunit ribosomal protein L30